jgi:hypothetical protein
MLGRGGLCLDGSSLLAVEETQGALAARAVRAHSRLQLVQ